MKKYRIDLKEFEGKTIGSLRIVSSIPSQYFEPVSMRSFECICLECGNRCTRTYNRIIKLYDKAACADCCRKRMSVAVKKERNINGFLIVKKFTR